MGDTYDWIIKNKNLESIIQTSKDDDLPNLITEYIKEKSLDEESVCIQLLICKSAPFIKAMQDAIKTDGKKKKKGRGALFQFLPSMDEVEKVSDECERKHPYCRLSY